MNIFLTAAKEIVLKKEEKRLIEIIRDVLYLMNRFTVCFGGVWRRIGRIQRGSLI